MLNDHKKIIISALWALSILIGLIFGYNAGKFYEFFVMGRDNNILLIKRDLNDLVSISKSPKKLIILKTHQVKLNIYSLVCGSGPELSESDAHFLANAMKRYNALVGGKLLAGHNSPVLLRRSQAQQDACKKLILPD